MNNKQVFLNALTFPEGARGGYFRNQQLESGFNKNEFIALMLDASAFFFQEFKERAAVSSGGEIERSPADIGLPIYFYNPPQTGHLRTSDLEKLLMVIKTEFVDNTGDPQQGRNPGGLKNAEYAALLYYSMEPHHFFNLTPALQKELGIYHKNLEMKINDIKNAKGKLDEMVSVKTLKKIIPLIKNEDGKRRAENDLEELE